MHASLLLYFPLHIVQAVAADIARVAAEADVADQQGLSTFSSGRLIIEPDTWQPESKGGRNKVYNPQSSENGLNTGQALDKAKLWCWVFSYVM